MEIISGGKKMFLRANAMFFRGYNSFVKEQNFLHVNSFSIYIQLHKSAFSINVIFYLARYIKCFVVLTMMSALKHGIF